MTNATPLTELGEFLACHEAVARPTLYAVGSVVGEWKVTAFLGSGGNAEVYRVVHIADESVAALKVLLRKDEASKMRFRQEAALLSKQMGAHFAKFCASGEIDGRPYLVTELLEPVDLPESEKGIVDYLLAVCRAAGVLHRAGLVHRDIKPSNIMRRSSGELVLIDLGLVKDTVRSSEPARDVSIVSGKAVAVGTPRFAAPEQMIGGEVTAATDIHAIGRLADVAFHSNPPRSWLPIIRRATSSIPAQRYASVEEFVRAIRRRHRPRLVGIAVFALVGLAVASFVLGRARSLRAPQPQQDEPPIVESVVWQSLCENVTTNLMVKELVWERLVTNSFENSTLVSPERAYRQVGKPMEATVVRLSGRTNEFARPLVLDASREYFIEGPGILAADIQVRGGPVRVHLKNCFVFNRSAVPVDRAGIRYVFEGGASLNFTDQDKPSHTSENDYVEGFDGAYDEIRFRRPATTRF